MWLWGGDSSILILLTSWTCVRGQRWASRRTWGTSPAGPAPHRTTTCPAAPALWSRRSCWNWGGCPSWPATGTEPGPANPPPSPPERGRGKQRERNGEWERKSVRKRKRCIIESLCAVYKSCSSFIWQYNHTASGRVNIILLLGLGDMFLCSSVSSKLSVTIKCIIITIIWLMRVLCISLHFCMLQGSFVKETSVSMWLPVEIKG